MPLVMNCTNETQKVRALGNWFEFKPKQVKMMKDELAEFIGQERKEFGLVVLPESFEEPEYKHSPAGQEELEKLESEGIEAYINRLRKLIYNNQVSLRGDLEKSNMKTDPAVYASEKGPDGSSTLDYMRILASYQQKRADEEQKRIDEVKHLMKSVGPVSK